MLSKVLAGVFAAAVLTVGGYAYYQYATGAPDPVTDPATQPATGCCAVQSIAAPSCCQEPTRAAAVSSCCGDDAPAATVEVLAVQPREVK
jgi:hypothetical protein